MPFRYLLLGSLVLAAACNPDQQYHRATHRDTFFQSPPANVDILWVVDNSQSMTQEQEQVATRFSEFVVHLEDTNIDFHLGVITTDMDPDNPDRARLLGDPPVLTKDMSDYQQRFSDRVRVGITGSDKERGLEAAVAALSEPMVSDANAGFYRRDAALSVIVVSDENDCSDRGALGAYATGMDCYDNSHLLVPVRDFVNELLAMKDDPQKVLFSAIVGPPIEENCPDTVPGTRYLSVAASLGGIQADICDHDFTGLMGDLGLVVSGVRSSFQLTYQPVLETLEIWVGPSEDDEEGWEEVFEDAAEGWSYDETTRYVTFHGDSIPPRGYVMTAIYEIAGT